MNLLRLEHDLPWCGACRTSKVTPVRECSGQVQTEHNGKSKLALRGTRLIGTALDVHPGSWTENMSDAETPRISTQ